MVILLVSSEDVGKSTMPHLGDLRKTIGLADLINIVQLNALGHHEYQLDCIANANQ